MASGSVFSQLSLGAAFSISPRTITTDLAKPSVCSRYSSGFSGALANRNIQWADNIATEKYMGVGKRGLGRLRAELDVKEPGLQQKSVGAIICCSEPQTESSGLAAL